MGIPLLANKESLASLVPGHFKGGSSIPDSTDSKISFHGLIHNCHVPTYRACLPIPDCLIKMLDRGIIITLLGPPTTSQEQIEMNCETCQEVHINFSWSLWNFYFLNVIRKHDHILVKSSYLSVEIKSTIESARGSPDWLQLGQLFFALHERKRIITVNSTWVASSLSHGITQREKRINSHLRAPSVLHLIKPSLANDKDLFVR